ncbi:MAG: hypothetical protein MJ252_06445 [archaeon]|nr:hypothetical protein [archaeon]
MRKNNIIKIPSKQIVLEDNYYTDQQIFRTKSQCSNNSSNTSETSFQGIITKNLDKYKFNQGNYSSALIESLLERKNCHFLVEFEEMNHLLNSDTTIKKYYTTTQSQNRIQKYSAYYKNYIKFLVKATLVDQKLNKLIHNCAKEKAQNYVVLHYKKKEPEIETEEMNNQQPNDDIFFETNIRETIENYSTTMTCESHEPLLFPADILRKCNEEKLSKEKKNKKENITRNIYIQDEKKDTINENEGYNLLSFSESGINRNEERTEDNESLLSIMENLKHKAKIKEEKPQVKTHLKKEKNQTDNLDKIMTQRLKTIKNNPTTVKKISRKTTLNPKEKIIKKLNLQPNEKRTHSKATSNNLFQSTMVKKSMARTILERLEENKKKNFHINLDSTKTSNVQNMQKKSSFKNHKAQCSGGLTIRKEKPINQNIKKRNKKSEIKSLIKRSLAGTFTGTFTGSTIDLEGNYFKGHRNTMKNLNDLFTSSICDNDFFKDKKENDKIKSKSILKTCFNLIKKKVEDSSLKMSMANKKNNSNSSGANQTHNNSDPKKRNTKSQAKCRLKKEIYPYSSRPSTKLNERLIEKVNEKTKTQKTTSSNYDLRNSQKFLSQNDLVKSLRSLNTRYSFSNACFLKKAKSFKQP